MLDRHFRSVGKISSNESGLYGWLERPDLLGNDGQGQYTLLSRQGWFDQDGDFLCTTYTTTWVRHLPEDDPLVQQAKLLMQTLQTLSWTKPDRRLHAVNTALRLLLVHGYESLTQITEQDLLAIPLVAQSGSDVLDAGLCALGSFSRTPQRAASRHTRQARRSPTELVAAVQMPEQFRPITALYLETFARRISAVYGNTAAQGSCARTLLAFPG